MAKIEAIKGRYIYLTIQEVEYRVYFEESGEGIPLICQHAGAGDGLEWRYILNDSDITEKYHVIVPDLPYHGKSLPPESTEWWKQEYKLTKSFFVDFHLELIKALKLDRPVFFGNALGGNLAPELALEYPDVFRAIIAYGCNLGGGKGTPDSFFDHPYVTNQFRRPFSMYFCSPLSPEKYRRSVSWCAMQTALGEKGDLNYVINEHDLNGKTDKFDTSRCAVYFLSGNYNPTSSLEDSKTLSELINGSKLIEMEGLSLLGMAENPPLFKTYLMPVLNEIAEKCS